MTARVAVIGAGMVGVCAASSLQQDGHEVVLIDVGEPGMGTSFGNAGGLNPATIVPVSMPGMLKNIPKWLGDPLGPVAIRWRHLPRLAPWLVRFVRAGHPDRVIEQARALRSLLAPCHQYLGPLVKAAGAEDLIRRQGGLFAFRSEEGYRRDRPNWELRRQNGIAWEELSQDELRQLEPALARDFVRGILIPENAHTINPHRLVSRLAAAFQRRGGRIRRAHAKGFRLEGSRLRTILTLEGEIEADRAVVAAGAWSKPLARELGDWVPLESQRGYHVMIRDPEVMPRISTADVEQRLAVTPMETGLRLAGTVELAGLSAPPDWRRARVLLEHGRRMFPGLARHHPEERLTQWMGHRPCTPDSLPVIGPSKRSPDVVYAFGHGHVGMAMAPMTGKIVADLIAGRVPAIDLAPFRADRF